MKTTAYKFKDASGSASPVPVPGHGHARKIAVQFSGTAGPETVFIKHGSLNLDEGRKPERYAGSVGRKWMKAVYLEKKGDVESLVVGQIPQPVPKRGEVLVKVHATAVTPAELQWFPTFHTASGQPRPFPIVLGHEFSGMVEALGDGVEQFKAGEEVFGLNDWFTNGAQAEYCVAPAATLALKPRLLDAVRSAVVPISALTAWQGLMEKVELQPGQRILIHGAAGGVGMFATQMARWRGAHVIGTASTGNVDFARALGAHEVIDYRTIPFDEVVRDVDVIFDAVGGETLERSWKVLSKYGKAVTVATQSAQATDPRVRDAFMLVRADGRQLQQISHWIDDGELLVFSAGAFLLAQVREAFAWAKQGGLRGKVALRVEEEV